MGRPCWAVSQSKRVLACVLACVLAIYETVLHMSTPYNCIMWSNFTFCSNIYIYNTVNVEWAERGAELTESKRLVFRVGKIPPKNNYISLKNEYSIVIEVQYIIYMPILYFGMAKIAWYRSFKTCFTDKPDYIYRLADSELYGNLSNHILCL